MVRTWRLGLILALGGALLAGAAPLTPVQARPPGAAQLLTVLPLESSSLGVVSTYRVQSGDSLSGIAELLAVDVDTLRDLNNLGDPNAIPEGLVLVVPDVPTKPVRFGNAPPKIRYHPEAPSFVWPAVGPITTRFGVPGADWIGGYHMGLDIGAPAGAPVVAAASGVVEAAELDHQHGYGNYVLIDHGGSYETLYGHLSRLATTPGATVQLGDLIGYVGSSGYAVGPHLHFEIRYLGERIDPEPFLP